MRTENQREANIFDVRLYALIHRSLDSAKDAGESPDGRAWKLVAAYLEAARRQVRDMMAPSDLKDTEGECHGNVHYLHGVQPTADEGHDAA